MKSHIILTSAAALLVSVAGANAFEYRPFVGLNMAIQNVTYSDAAKDLERLAGIDLPTDFFAFGIEGGIRFGAYNDIYNGGLTLTATKTTYSDIQNKYTNVHEADTDMFNISATYDNYIRISGDKSHRIDLVLGAGMGAMAYHIDPVVGDSETLWAFSPELKVGMDFELTHNVTLAADARLFVPVRSHYDMDTSYTFGGTIKYLF